MANCVPSSGRLAEAELFALGPGKAPAPPKLKVLTVHAGFGSLQVEADSLAVDQHGSGVDQLLAGAVVALVTAQRGEGEEELDRLGACVGRRGLAGQVQVGAETDAIELGIVLEVAQDRANQV